MIEKLHSIFYFCIIFKHFYCFGSDIYTLKPEYQNKSYQATPVFDKIGFSLIECSVFCSGTPDCHIIFFNKISGKCEAFQTITDGNNFEYSEYTDVFEKERDVTLITEVSIPTSTPCPYTTSECRNSSYIKIDIQPDISPCFKVYTTDYRKPQEMAKSVCQSENSRLIVLSEPNVYQLVTGYISCVYKDISPSSHFWIGLEYSFGDEQWMWFDNSNHSSWSFDGENTCGMMYKTGDLYKGGCLSSENFICESEINLL